MRQVPDSSTTQLSPSKNHELSTAKQSVKPSTHSTFSSDSTSNPLPSVEFNEVSHVHVQHEVSQSRPLTLNLSTYGYSVNARDTTRMKALQDAIKHEGIDAVRSRLLDLIDKYDSHPDGWTEFRHRPPVVKILTEDYEWIEKYKIKTESLSKFEHQREQSKKRITQRIQETTKGRSRHRQHYRY